MTPETNPYHDSRSSGAFHDWIGQLAVAEQRRGSDALDAAPREQAVRRGEHPAGHPDEAAPRGNPPLDGGALSAGYATWDRVLGC